MGGGRMEGQTAAGNRPLCSTGHRPFGAAAQKVSETLKFSTFRLDHYGPTDRRMDGPTDGQSHL